MLFQELQTIRVLFWLAYAFAASASIYMAVRRAGSLRKKMASTAVVALAFGILPAINAKEAIERTLAQEQRAKYREAAWAHFRKRCNESAKESIARVVEDVKAIFLVKPRKLATEAQLKDQYWMGDPYGYSSYEALNPAGAYLYGRSGKTISGEQFTPIQGYQYVETPNPRHREQSSALPYLRYQLQSVVAVNSATGKPENRIEPRGKEVTELLSQYAIRWEDISTDEDRRFWVAGGNLTIVNLLNNEVIAERVGYVIDPRLGSTTGGRRTWLAVSFTPEVFCPKFEMQAHRNTEFVARVLRAPKASTNERK